MIHGCPNCAPGIPCGCRDADDRVIQPAPNDDDVPLDVQRTLMRAAVANGRISYLWLCGVYLAGVADSFDPSTQVPIGR